MATSRSDVLFVIFGLPGAGKTYVGELLRDDFGFYFYDGDDALPDAMKEAIVSQKPITDTQRDEFFGRLLAELRRLKREHPKLVVAQTFIREKYRRQILHDFPGTQFMLVQTRVDIREYRLAQRAHNPLDIEYARRMTAYFEPPLIDHWITFNDADGKQALQWQIRQHLNGG